MVRIRDDESIDIYINKNIGPTYTACLLLKTALYYEDWLHAGNDAATTRIERFLITP